MKAYVEKLKAAVLLQFDGNIAQDFVPLDGGTQPTVNEKDRFDLWDQLHRNFIGNPQRKSLLLIGGSGIGKTWFTQNLVRILWEDEVPFVPLWVRLTTIDNPPKDLLHQHLNKLKAYQLEKGVKKEERLTDDDISLFFQDKPALFLVLDGYDELSIEKREHQYYSENAWHQWGNLVQMLVTSRLEALPPKRALIFAPEVNHLFTEYYIQPFNRAQLERMVNQYCHTKASLPKEWTPKHYLEQLTTLYELHEFICKPFLVKVVLEVLPLVFEEIAAQSKQDQHPLLKKRLTRYNLYKKFLAQHFSRESERLYRVGVGGKIEIAYNSRLQPNSQTVTLPQILENFTSDLARDMFNHHVNIVKWSPPAQMTLPDFFASSSVAAMSEESNPRWLKPYFDDELYPHISYLRSGSPLVSLGFHEYAFLHYSILEFYAAEQLFNGVLQDSWYLTGRNLNKENLQTSPTDVLKNLAVRVQEEPELKEKLYEIIEQSKYVPEVWRAAANAITLLNCAVESFSGRDFKRIRIGGLEDPNNPHSGWGADLSHSVFSGADLSEADLRFVNFTQAHLANTLWVGTCMDGVNFGEQSRIEGSCFAFGNKGESLVVQSGGDLKIYAWPSRKLLSEFEVTDYWSTDISGFAFHPKQQQVAVIHSRKTFSGYKLYKINLWDVSTGCCTRNLLEYTSKEVSCISYSPDGSRLAVSMYYRYDDCRIQQWNVTSGSPLSGVIGLHHEVGRFAYSPDGSRLAACYDDHSLRQWDAITGELLLVFSGYATGTIVYHPHGNRLASYGKGDEVVEWNVMTGECLQRYSNAVGITYHPDGNRLLTGGRSNRYVKEWDIRTGAPLRSFSLCLYPSNFAYSPDGSYLMFTEWGSGIRQYDLATAAPLKLRDHHIGPIWSIAYHPDGTRIASAGNYSNWGAVGEWNIATGDLLQKYELNKGVFSVSYSNKGRLAAGGSHTVWQWDIATNNCYEPYRVEREVHSIIYSPDGTRIACVGLGDKAVQLNADTGAVLCLHKKGRCVAYSPDGKRIATGYWRSLVEWNAITGEILRTYDARSADCLSYSYDGQCLAAGYEAMIQEWDVTTGALLRTFKNNDSAKSVGYSPDNHYLAFTGFQHVALVDRKNSPKAVFKKKVHTGSVNALAWSPDSTKLATGGEDHAIRLWRISKASGQLNLELIWQTHSFLTSPGLNIHQVTGLSDNNYKLLRKSSHDTPLKGTCANPHLSTEKVLAGRNAQIYIPDGVLSIGQVGSYSDSYQVTQSDWLVSIVRHKNVKIKGSSDLTGQAGGHVWLLLMGLDENCFTIFQEIHLYLDTDAPTSGLLIKSGQGLISVRHRVPYDLFAELEKRAYEAKSWMIGKSQVASLLTNIERDRAEGLQYINTGHSPTFFEAPSFSCLTFCEKHLKAIGCTVLEDKAKPWYDFMLALPTRYLPTPPMLNNLHPTQDSGNCSLM